MFYSNVLLKILNIQLIFIEYVIILLVLFFFN